MQWLELFYFSRIQGNVGMMNWIFVRPLNHDPSRIPVPTYDNW